MIATDVAPDRLAAAKQAADNFVQALPRGIQLGLILLEQRQRGPHH